VRKKHAFIADYSKDWPVHDMLKVYLKNTSQTARNIKARETAEAIDQVSFYLGDIKKSLTARIVRETSVVIRKYESA
jgi:hypothetical protein